RRNDSLAGQDQAGDLADAAPELEEAPEIGDGERAELPVGRIHGLHELEQLAETLLRLGVGRSRPVQQGDTLAKHGEGGIHLPAAADNGRAAVAVNSVWSDITEIRDRRQAMTARC